MPVKLNSFISRQELKRPLCLSWRREIMNGKFRHNSTILALFSWTTAPLTLRLTEELTELQLLSEEYVRGWSKSTTSLLQPRYLCSELYVRVSCRNHVKLWDFSYALYQDYLGTKLTRQSAPHRYTIKGKYFEHRVHSSWSADVMVRACATQAQIKTAKKSLIWTAFHWDTRPVVALEVPTLEDFK